MGDKTRDWKELARLLEEKEFDIEQAMEICADDMDLYIEVLKTAMEEGRRKIPIIRSSMEKRDYERYHIEVHGLKHAMLAIGAMELSALSSEQEIAVKDGDAERVSAGYEVLIVKYEELVAFLQNLFEP
jgi:HPt (histidine-containing phosphotransfer) domain-containing protein